MRSKVYLVYLVISLLTIFSLVLYFSLSSVQKSLESKKGEFLSYKNKINNIEKDLIRLKELVQKNGLFPVKKKEAKVIVLREINHFIEMYDAEIIKPVTDENGVYSATVVFKYYPESAIELMELIRKFKEKKYPILMVNRFFLENLEEGSIVTLEITLEQPYVK